jgi:uncharacterized membrane protein YhaH (DUF805 family)
VAKVFLIFQPLVKYADFSGRAHRSEFWLWLLLRTGLTAILVLTMTPSFAPGLPQREMLLIFLRNYFLASPLNSLVELGLLIPTLAVAVRRLHDVNRSGWWIVLPQAVILASLITFLLITNTNVSSLIAASYGDTPASHDAIIGGALLNAIGMLLLFAGVPSLVISIDILSAFFHKGTKGPNRFGADPKLRVEATQNLASKTSEAV